MRNGSKTSVASGVMAGVAGGLLASWIMNLFIESVGPKLQQAVQADGEAQRASGNEPSQDEADSAPGEDATMKAAGRLARAFAGRELNYEQKKTGGPIVHYAFGALMGGIYGGLAEHSPKVTNGFGTAFGGALFAGADVIAVPALNLAAASNDLPALATPFAAHLVYGATTELVRRVMRTAL
jgi:putative membrane protein